jgi:hypothetical protein
MDAVMNPPARRRETAGAQRARAFTEHDLPRDEFGDVDIEAIPLMMEIIEEGINAPDSECDDVPEDWINRNV